MKVRKELLYINGKEQSLVAADIIANTFGFQYAERLVESIKKSFPNCPKCGSNENIKLALHRDHHTHFCTFHEQDLFFTPPELREDNVRKFFKDNFALC